MDYRKKPERHICPTLPRRMAGGGRPSARPPPDREGAGGRGDRQLNPALTNDAKLMPAYRKLAGVSTIVKVQAKKPERPGARPIWVILGATPKPRGAERQEELSQGRLPREKPSQEEPLRRDLPRKDSLLEQLQPAEPLSGTPQASRARCPHSWERPAPPWERPAPRLSVLANLPVPIFAPHSSDIRTIRPQRR